MNPLNKLHDLGQSIWLDNIRRALLTSGKLAQYVRDLSVTGLTSNPTIFERAIAGSSDYDDAILTRLDKGLTTERLFFELALADITEAADLFLPIFNATDTIDGFVSLEVSPGLADDSDGTIAEARRLHADAGRSNLFIKVPGTEAGRVAIEELIFSGIPVNVTLLFSTQHYLDAAEAYLRGIERRVQAGLPADVRSVASVFISRWDAAANPQLPENLHNRLGVAIGKRTYRAYRDLLASPRWQTLAAAGAKPQRLLWASTGTKDPSLPDNYYITALAAEQTVNTMPEGTLLAFARHGEVREVLPVDAANADKTIEKIVQAGVDVDALGRELQIKGRDSFVASFDKLLNRMDAKLAQLHEARDQERETLGDLSAKVDAAVRGLTEHDACHRIWSIDHELWQEDGTEIDNRLGWLVSPAEMEEQLDDLHSFRSEAAADGLTHVLWCGMGGSSLFPQVLLRSFGIGAEGLDLRVLDTSDPASVRRMADMLPMDKTLFLFASKSGGTLETRSHLAYFWERVGRAEQFAVVTDAGTSLDEHATRHGFRRVFRNNPNIGGRYSALSHFGLVPGVMLGADIGELLNRAGYMMAATSPCVPDSQNPGLRFGAVLGTAAKAGRDKCTLVMPGEVESFSMWLEQLIAESTGKRGTGILPVAGETIGPPEVYGDDRIFVALGDAPGLAALADAGHPVVRLPFVDLCSLGEEVFRWEFAVAVAGAVLGINPFDQPNVEAAKQAAAKVLEQGMPDIPVDSPESLLDQASTGDYIAIQAYIDIESPRIADLQQVRMALRDRYRVATTLGIGPRYLHSTGQLHKGGPPTGLFLQVVGDDPEDTPIPGKPYGFSTLKQAQAAGDYLALKERGLRVARVTMEALLALA